MENCYANALGDCEGKVSREHFISRSILNYGQPDKQGIDLAGPGGYHKPTGANRLASAKNLCNHHNSLLSVLDEEMLRLIDRVFQWKTEEVGGSDTFDGSLISRWLMKYAAGGLSAGMIPGHAPDYMFQRDWLDILFGRVEFPDWCGFDIEGNSDIFTDEVVAGGVPPYCVSPRHSPQREVKGAMIGIHPFALTTFFEKGISLRTQSFRVSEAYLNRADSQAPLELDFTWSDARGVVIELTLS